MRELNLSEIQSVEGGIIPLIPVVAAVVTSSKALAGGFALGIAVGSIWALVE